MKRLECYGLKGFMNNMFWVRVRNNKNDMWLQLHLSFLYINMDLNILNKKSTTNPDYQQTWVSLLLNIFNLMVITAL